MNIRDQFQTIALTYQAMCQGEHPWIAVGNFLNEWFDYAKDQREQLVTEPLILPEEPDTYALRWAAFCAASVEWLCSCYGIPCPSWVYNSTYSLSEPWFDSPIQVRERLLLQTPEPFARRNVYCGNRMFANKYEFAEQYQHLSTTPSSATPTLS